VKEKRKEQKRNDLFGMVVKNKKRRISRRKPVVGLCVCVSAGPNNRRSEKGNSRENKLQTHNRL
jgi:hypothetical protein